jgi:predicted glycoside hydrolase/deacetylase ChbG (UPF0249 family)
MGGEVMKLIINADDFGLCPGQNLGIQSAHRHGIVTSASLMANGRWFAEAIAIAHENPTLGIGVHLVLSAGKPILPLSDVKSLVDSDGFFHKFNDAKHINADMSELEKEWRAQIEKVLSHGIIPDHLDGHHHLHLHPDIFATTLKLAKEYHLPIRWIPGSDPNREKEQMRKQHVNYVYCLHDFFMEGVSNEYFYNFVGLHEHLDQDHFDVMCHPAYLDPYIMTHSKYTLYRVKELGVLTDKSVKEALLEHNIELTTYKQFG